jgi:uncharacterized membrane protein
MKDSALFSLELKIAKLLRYGVIIAGIFLLAGWVGHLDFSGNPLVAFHDYAPIPFAQMIEKAWAVGDVSQILSQIGLIALISLPLLRVAMTGYLFVKQKDFALAGIAFFVFVVLIISCSLGIAL